MSHKWNHNFPKIAREAGFTIRELSVGHCIDWRFIASIDPYAIVSERDYEKLDEFIPHISEVPIGSVLNNRILDPAIGKYFVLAQFSVQYLQFCKQFLDETVLEIRNTAQDVQKENARLEKICRKKNDELMVLHRKLQRAENAQIQQHSVFPCSKCTKNFISSELLHAHMVRKHGGAHEPESTGRKLSETDSNLINTIKLELEVKQLKERLNVAEKDLMDQRSREHRCHGYDRDREKPEQVKQTQIELKNVAIQSNLEDLKDVNEKEVQTSIRSKTPETPPRLSPIQRFTPSPVPVDYISKADLEAIVREQKEQFETWKALEREKFNGELEQVRRNLTEAIRELENRPQTVVTVPAVEPVVRQSNEEEDTRIWKQRYQELEKMYENSQKQVRETVQNVEAVYEEKFRQLERRMERKETPAIVEKVVIRKEEKKVVPPQEPEPEESEIDEAIEHESEEAAQTESDDEIRALEAAKARFLAKAAVESPPEARHVPVQKPEKKLISPKKQILNTFKTRLKALGIDPKAKSLAKDDLNTAAEALAERRDVSRKKNRGFFITRNQLLAKVDQIAKGKIGETGKSLKSIKPEDLPVIKKKENVPQPIPKFRSTLQTPSDILPDRPTAPNSNLFKIKSVNSNYLTVPEVKTPNNDEILTVQAEINAPPSLRTSPRASISDYERHLERLLDTPIKQVGTPPDLVTVEQHRREVEESDSSEPMVTAKPIPKKRVLFNLDKPNTPTATTEGPPVAGPTLSSTVIHVSRADEESDWNISSFEDEK